MNRANSVLIVEDESSQADNLSNLFADMGYDVVGVVPTAEDALAVYQSCIP
jgi:DNA-binding NtrC family response regulator